MHNKKGNLNMLLLKQWEKEKTTLHHLSQILGKYKLSSRFKEPQWAHVILDITTSGFSTGILFYENQTYQINVNLLDDRIEVITENKTTYIDLKNGKTIKYYYEEIESSLKEQGIHVVLNKKPQETEDRTPFDQDEIHHHYDKNISKIVLQIMHFALKVEYRFISEYRKRKVNPGLFWGTFDIACLINNDQIHKSFDEDMVIESNVFDEHFIEFGFWFGDDNFTKPTFFILPHPFIDESFSYDLEMPEGAYLDKNLGEFVLSIDDLSDDTAAKLVKFMENGFDIFKRYLKWEDADYCSIPLGIKDNQMERNCKF